MHKEKRSSATMRQIHLNIGITMYFCIPFNFINKTHLEFSWAQLICNT